MRKVLVTIANLLLPGSAQVVRDEFAWGVTFAVGYGAALSVALVSLVLAPGLLSRAALGLLFAAALAFWLASQVLHLGALQSGRGDAGAPGPEALAEVTRLWLRGERAQALAHLEALLRRWPREPVLHFVAAQLWGEGTDPAARARARESLALCLACDLDGRWRRAAERELSLLVEPGRGTGG